MAYQYAYSYFNIASNANTLLANSYLTNLRQRADSGSGTMVDQTATLELYRTLIEQNLISTLRRGYSDLAAVRINDVAGTLFVQERFDLNDGTLGGASSSVNAVQSTATNQAGWAVDADTGRRQTTYDASNDFHTVADLGVFRNQTAGTIFIIAKDTNTTGGDSGHLAVYISDNTVLGPVRAGLYTRLSTNIFQSRGKRLDADAASLQSIASVTGYSSLANLSLWGGNALYLYYNGTISSASTFASGGGSTSDTDSNAFRLGAVDATTNRFPGVISEVLIFRTVLSLAQLDALRNFYRRYYPTLP